MRSRDPFEGFERDLNYWKASGETVSVPTPHGTERIEPSQLRFQLYTGLFALLADVLADACETDEEFELSTILSKAKTVEPTLRFDLFDKKGQVERTEMVAPAGIEPATR